MDWYPDRMGELKARQAGEQVLVDLLGPAPRRMLDLGCGDGLLTSLVLKNRPSVTEAVAIDRAPPILDKAQNRFFGDERVAVQEHHLR